MLETGVAGSVHKRRDDSFKSLSLKSLRMYPDSNVVIDRQSGH